jgi:ribosomal protein S18 acetylase RimI-like enzyme
MRGKGIGTRLLESVFDFARTEGFSSVRLDVVDTNPGARRLYERMGFVPVKTGHYPYLRRVMGFSAGTTMIREIG